MAADPELFPVGSFPEKCYEGQQTITRRHKNEGKEKAKLQINTGRE